MGSKYAIHLILIALIVVGALIPAALYVRSLLEVNLKGVVDVKPNIKVVDVEFSIDDGVGEKLIDLGNIHIPAGNVIIRSRLVSYEGNFTLILSGELMLESNTSSYRVLMPCLANIGDHCYRIMMLIPGYDAPLPISEGDYNATLTIRWSAEGVGRFHLKLVLEFSETTGNVSISVIGIKPGSIDGWVVAHNSTRSYSMLVNPVSDTSALVWVWIFDPSNVSSNLLTFEVIEDSTGREISEEVVEMFRDGVYWSVLVEVDVPIGRYVIKSSFGDVVMSATIGPH
ncbi:MAG: hypothetical protein QXO98_05675 [Sulfolobales archaeon]